MKFEQGYQKLVQDVLDNGELREGRNGYTKSLFGKTLEVDMSNSNEFPLIVGRKMFPKGILGEFAAMIRGPHHLDDFEKFGCNYWKDWAQPNGYIDVDYGNAWLNFGGVNQLDNLRDLLRNNPMDRRMIITGWNPANMDNLDLPCCHLLYQWYVRDNKYLDMIWYQRSADSMIGIPSDIVLAAIWNVMLANEVAYLPGKITMVFGDTHIYEEHFDAAADYASRDLTHTNHPSYRLTIPWSTPIERFEPAMLELTNYAPMEAIKFELKS